MGRGGNPRSVLLSGKSRFSKPVEIVEDNIEDVSLNLVDQERSDGRTGQFGSLDLTSYYKTNFTDDEKRVLKYIEEENMVFPDQIAANLGWDEKDVLATVESIGSEFIEAQNEVLSLVEPLDNKVMAGKLEVKSFLNKKAAPKALIGFNLFKKGSPEIISFELGNEEIKLRTIKFTQCLKKILANKEGDDLKRSIRFKVVRGASTEIEAIFSYIPETETVSFFLLGPGENYRDIQTDEDHPNFICSFTEEEAEGFVQIAGMQKPSIDSLLK